MEHKITQSEGLFLHLVKDGKRSGALLVRLDNFGFTILTYSQGSELTDSGEWSTMVEGKVPEEAFSFYEEFLFSKIGKGLN